MNKVSFLGTMLTVMRKELRDFTRDRRTLLLTLLVAPLLYPVIFLGMGKLSELRKETQLDKPLELPVVGIERAPNLIAYLAGNGINAKAAPADIEARIRSQQEDVALAIDPEFARDWRAGKPAKVEIVTDTTRRNADVPAARVREALNQYGQTVGSLRLLARGINPMVAAPLNTGTRDLATPEAKSGMFMTILLPMILTIFAFIGGSHLAMDTTAGERERQSLEPLLATPASRGAIVSGKMIAACLVGIASLLLTLLAFKLSAQFAGGMAQMLDVRFAAIAKLLLILLPMLFIGTTLLSYLSAASKSMKEAQSHMTWLMLLPMLPIMLLAVNPLKYEPWQFAVPFLAQNQMIQKVIRAEPVDPQTWAIYLAAGFGLAAVLWFAAVRRYHQEKLAISG